MNASGDAGPHGGRSRLVSLTLTALGVVYGDIGTSPLYALRESFYGSHAVPPSHENVLGVLSFVLYALLLIIAIKYIVVVMRAEDIADGQAGQRVERGLQRFGGTQIGDRDIRALTD